MQSISISRAEIHLSTDQKCVIIVLYIKEATFTWCAFLIYCFASLLTLCSCWVYLCFFSLPSSSSFFSFHLILWNYKKKITASFLYALMFGFLFKQIKLNKYPFQSECMSAFRLKCVFLLSFNAIFVLNCMSILFTIVLLIYGRKQK